MMSAAQVIELYKSKPLEDMTRDELLCLKFGFLDWLFLKEYQEDGEKRGKLNRVLTKIEVLLSSNPDEVTIAKTLF